MVDWWSLLAFAKKNSSVSRLTVLIPAYMTNHPKGARTKIIHQIHRWLELDFTDLRVTPMAGLAFVTQAVGSHGLTVSLARFKPFDQRDRGNNEHINGELRILYLKGEPRDDMICADMTHAEDVVNHRLQKILAYAILTTRSRPTPRRTLHSLPHH